MTKQQEKWTAFPHDASAYEYTGTALEKRWPRLHRGDREAFPSQVLLQRLVTSNPGLEPSMTLKKAANLLQDAWRAYHRGDFAAALGIPSEELP